jgi:deoxyribose-phosphate aldolase
VPGARDVRPVCLGKVASMSLVLLRELESRFMSDVWCEALEQAGIPHLLRTYQDTAYGELYVSQRGYGSLFVAEDWLEKARQVDKDLEASTSPVPFDTVSLARKLDFNLYDPMAGLTHLEIFAERCVEMGCAAACVSPWLVKSAAPLLAGSRVALCAPVGYPLGSDTTRTKCEAARELVSAGAAELELGLNHGLLSSSGIEQAVEEVKAVAEATAGIPLKVVLETSRLDKELTQEAAQALAESQAVSYLKTGSGFFGQASLEQIGILHEAVGGAVGLKAEGGVKDVPSLLKLCEAGAGRIGTSHAYEIWREAAKRWPAQD